MGDNHRICQICHVEEKYCSEKLFFARFPLDENRCKQWVKLVGIEDLVHLPIEKLHDLRYVCGKHFAKDEEEEDKVRNKENKENDDEFPTISIPEIEDEDIEENLINASGQAVVYLSGYIASRLLKNNTCDECKQCLSIENPQQNPMYSYTLLREWWQHKLSLTYPTVNLCKLVQTATNVAENEVTNILHEKNIIQITITLFEVHCEFAWFTCKTHAKTLLRVIFTKLALILIRRACQKINIKYASAEMPLADAVKKAQQVGKDK